MSKPGTEAWQRGPVEHVPPMLQPVAHALIQAGDEIDEVLEGFPDNLLWKKPSGVASVAFHLQHIRGVIDRLFTYARGEALSEAQLKQLAAEGQENASISTSELLNDIKTGIERAMEELKATDDNSLLEFRGVGRKQIPSTVIGLLFHAAEHTQRHTGQLLVTVRILRSEVSEAM